MSLLNRVLIIGAMAAGQIVLLTALGVGIVWQSDRKEWPLLAGLLFFLVTALFYGWVLYAFLNYRQGRQEELLHLMTTAVEAQVPLAPALWVYLDDRPRGPVREFWVGALLLFVAPAYYLVWHRLYSFDRQVALVADQLEHGLSLSEALRSAPGILPPDVILAAEVGQATGRLAPCLRIATRSRLGPVWVQVLPRFLYPLFIVLVISFVTTFQILYVVPRMDRIYHDFGGRLPMPTEMFVDAYRLLFEKGLGALGFGLVLVLVILLVFSPSFRWGFPGIGRLYRMHLQSRVLKMLGLLLDAGRTVPEALSLLADSGHLPAVARRRLLVARGAVEQGGPLADSLQRAGLLSAAAAPLIHAAQRVGNLPWALEELGDTLANRTVRLLHRISAVVTPILIFAVGLLVGAVVISLFIPLIDLIGRAGESVRMPG